MKRRNGTGSIIKVSGLRKPYKVMSPMICGNTVTKPRFLGYYATVQEAEAALQRHIPISADATFGQICERWIESREYKLSHSRINALKSALGHCTSLHKKPIGSLRLQDLTDVFLQNKNCGKKTVEDIRSLICGTFSYAYRYEIITENYAAHLTQDDLMWTESDKDTLKLLSPDEIKRLVSAPRGQVNDILVIALYTGLRVRSELLTLCRSNFRFDNGVYLVCGAKTAAGKNRTVPVHKDILPLLMEYYEKAENDLFDISYNIVLRQICRKYNGHTLHHLRHTFRSRLDLLDANHRCAEIIMGHSIRTIEDVYIHKNIDDLAATISLLDFGYIYHP